MLIWTSISNNFIRHQGLNLNTLLYWIGKASRKISFVWPTIWKQKQIKNWFYLFFFGGLVHDKHSSIFQTGERHLFGLKRRQYLSFDLYDKDLWYFILIAVRIFTMLFYYIGITNLSCWFSWKTPSLLLSPVYFYFLPKPVIFNPRDLYVSLFLKVRLVLRHFGQV